MKMKYQYEEKQEYIDRRFEQLGLNPSTANMVFFWKPKTQGAAIDQACCCQWWSAPFLFEGVKFRTAEHAMMYGKAKMFGDEKIMARILAEPHAHEAKKLGRLVKKFDDEVWNAKHYQLVYDISVAKFTQLAKEKAWLLSLPENTVFVEASPFDELWGILRENTGQVDLTDTKKLARV